VRLRGRSVLAEATDGAASPRQWLAEKRQQTKADCHATLAHRLPLYSTPEIGVYPWSNSAKQEPAGVSNTSARADPSYERFLTAAHLPGLDGLRCLGDLARNIWHTTRHRACCPGCSAKARSGWIVLRLSGFFDHTLLLRERGKNGRIGLGAFTRGARCASFRSTYVCWRSTPASLQTQKARSCAAFLHGLPFHATYTANWFLTTRCRIR